MILAVYTLWGGRRHTTVIAPFNLPPGDNLPFSSRTVANALRDAFARIRSEVDTGLAEYSARGLAPVIEKQFRKRSNVEDPSRTTRDRSMRESDSPGPPISVDMAQHELGSMSFGSPTFSQFSLPTNIEVLTQFQAEVQGISPEALLSVGRRVLGNERLVSGDILSGESSDEFYVIARASDGGPWRLGPFKTYSDGLRLACERLALELLKAFDPSFFAAHQISQGKFEEALRTLTGVLSND